MIVVSDASPILNLAAVGKLHLLRDLYGEIIVPLTVQKELFRNEIDLDPSWTRVVKARNQNEVAALLVQLDPGEAGAIIVAVALQARLLLLDENRGRRITILRGLEVTGLLGVLAEAKARGLIANCQPILDDMIRVAGFWIGDDLRTRYLTSLKELDSISRPLPSPPTLLN